MTDQERKVMEMALEALDSCEFDYDYDENPYNTFDEDLVNDATDALRQALNVDAIDTSSTYVDKNEKREHEPTWWMYRVNGTYTNFSREKPPEDAYDEGTLEPLYSEVPRSDYYQGWKVGHNAALAKKAEEEARLNKQPTKLFGPNLEQLLNDAGFYRQPKQEPWDTSDMAHRPGGLSMEQSIAQPEQQPVAWITRRTGDGGVVLSGYETCDPTDYDATPVYTAPPSKPWVSLTDDEFDNIYYRHDTYDSFARAIEAALKERNNG